MWNLFNCYLSGRHDYGMWCEPGAIFLRCVHCGKRSSGWAVIPKPALAAQCVPVAHATVAQVTNGARRRDRALDGQDARASVRRGAPYGRRRLTRRSMPS